MILEKALRKESKIFNFSIYREIEIESIEQVC